MQVFLSVYVDDVKMAGKNSDKPKMWATLQNKVDLNDPVSFLDQVCLGCTQRAAQVNTRIVMEEQKMFSKLISADTDVDTGENSPKDVTAWSYGMQSHAQNRGERYWKVAHRIRYFLDVLSEQHKSITKCDGRAENVFGADWRKYGCQH